MEVVEPAEFVVGSPVANHVGAEASVGREAEAQRRSFMALEIREDAREPDR